MNDVIKLLPDSVANQIAAGEVIQRPASVVKELVENSVDAGADQIKVVLKDAGRTLIQVIDNGCGMSDTDARLAFERHSTSKISSASDLFALSTMGFRGEALASIAAVSQVELRTMRREDTIGTRLCINGSKVESQEPEAMIPGSNMMVKNLFFNIPVRRKFLRKDSVELTNIIHEFERLALVNSGRELTIIHNDTVIHQLIPGSLKQRIGQLFGKAVEKTLIPVDTSTSLVKISGFVSLPDSARKRNWLQYFFVNGRNMKHPYFQKAIMQCYEKLIGPDVQPNFFINFEVDPAAIDVNIHPTKNEIKFENEQAIWQILNAAVRESLGRFNVAPAIDFNADVIPEIPAFTQGNSADAPMSVPDFGMGSSDYNPFDISRQSNSEPSHSGGIKSSALNWQRESRNALNNWDKLYANWNNTQGDERPQQNDFMTVVSHETSTPENDLFDSAGTPAAEYSSVMQFKNKYILSPVRSGLLIIDQYRAHVRILYERYIKNFTEAVSTSQSLIFPETLVLTPSQEQVLDDMLQSLREIGFDLERVTTGSWAINGLPAAISEYNPVELLTSIIDTVAVRSSEIEKDLFSDIALGMARSTAMKSGRQLTVQEMEQLLSDLFMLPTPTYTPDGLLILKIIDTETLTSSF